MRRMNVRDLHRFHVKTESGVELGKCKDVCIDMDTGRVLQIIVSRHIISSGDDLLISIDDVRDVTEDSIVVRDTSIGFGALVAA